MAKAVTASDFSVLVSDLESALNVVKDKKGANDAAQAAAVDAKRDYDASVRAAQVAHSAYTAHVSEIMAGFAQVHQ